jgi:hypothetical protein
LCLFESSWRALKAVSLIRKEIVTVFSFKPEDLNSGSGEADISL